MNRLPFLKMSQKESTVQISSFLGLNRETVIRENEFADMKNMSSDKFPAISTRRNRGEVIKKLSKPHGLYHKNGLIYVDGTELYYKHSKIADVTDTEKVFCGVGAFLIILPDKIMYNTSTGEMKQMEAFWQQTATATFEPLVEGATMIKVSCTGIGKNFSKYDGVAMSGCTNDGFNKTFTIQDKEDDYIVLIGDLVERFTQGSGLKIERTMPDMDFLCENENRLWGCSSKNHEVYASKLGDPTNWNAFEGISTDSYAATIGSDGDFTGCISYLGYVMFFKEDTIHKVYGSKPSNYQIMTSGVNGVALDCVKTISVVNETLFYVSRNGVCIFNGAQPEIVSATLKDLVFGAGVGGQYNNKYYASLKDKNGYWYMYTYDMERKIWSKEDNLHLIHCVNGEGDLYCIDSDGNLFAIAGKRKELIEWYLETGDMTEGAFDFKYIKRIVFNLIMRPESEANIYIKYDESQDWQLLNTLIAKMHRSQTINILPRRCVSYRIRLSGFGDVTLIGISKKIGYGTEISN